jgi:hypothetical protein
MAIGAMVFGKRGSREDDDRMKAIQGKIFRSNL